MALRAGEERDDACDVLGLPEPLERDGVGQLLDLLNELRGRDINVNAGAPGPTATDLFLDVFVSVGVMPTTVTCFRCI